METSFEEHPSWYPIVLGKVFHRSNQMYELKHLVWFGRDAPEKSVAGLRESLFLVLLQNFAKGLEKYRNNERRHWELWLNS